MQLIFKAFIDVFLLRKGPDDLPKSSLLLAVAIGMSIVVNFLFYAIIESELPTNLLLELATEFVKIASYLLILVVFGLVSRIMQTMTAIIACNAILGLLLTMILMVSQQFLNKELDAAFAWLVGEVHPRSRKQELKLDGHNRCFAFSHHFRNLRRGVLPDEEHRSF